MSWARESGLKRPWKVNGSLDPPCQSHEASPGLTLSVMSESSVAFPHLSFVLLCSIPSSKPSRSGRLEIIRRDSQTLEVMWNRLFSLDGNNINTKAGRRRATNPADL